MKKYFKNITGVSFGATILFFIYAFLSSGFDLNLILISAGIFIVLTLLMSILYLVAVKIFKKEPDAMMKDIKRGADDAFWGV